jgi:hypothetical protein
MPGGMLSKGRSHPLERWGLLVVCLGQIAFLAAILLAQRHSRQLDEPVVLMVLGGCILVSILGVLLVLQGRRRGSRQVMARAGRLCPRCRYPFLPTDEMGVCPECGDPFTLEDALMAWRERYPWLRL